MIGQFYPFPVTGIVSGGTNNPVNSRATDAASELANSVEWIVQDEY